MSIREFKLKIYKNKRDKINDKTEKELNKKVKRYRLKNCREQNSELKICTISMEKSDEKFN